MNRSIQISISNENSPNWAEEESKKTIREHKNLIYLAFGLNIFLKLKQYFVDKILV